jgi:hypothetical protein
MHSVQVGYLMGNVTEKDVLFFRGEKGALRGKLLPSAILVVPLSHLLVTTPALMISGI